MTLFIPRKQEIVGKIFSSAIGGSCQPSGFDPQHLEQALRQNFLAIQNWANTQNVAVSIGSTAVANVPGTSDFVGTGTFTNYDYWKMADLTTGELNLTYPGVWLCQTAFTVSNAGAGAIIGVFFEDNASGDTSPRHEHTYSAGPWSNAISYTQVIEFVPPTRLTAHLQVSALDASTTQYQMKYFSALKLFDIPSPTQ